jgi:thiamine transporter
MNTKTNTKILTEASIMIALATILSMLKIYEAPLGGSVTLLSMVPIILISFRHNIIWGVFSGFVYALLQLLLGLKSISYVANAKSIFLVVIFDFIIAFTVLGLAGIFKNRIKNIYLSTILGILFAATLRFLCHFFVGGVVWYELTKEGGWNDYVATTSIWVYSFIYNISYMGPEIILTLFATPLFIRLSKKK